jgi:hypothetical protein
MSGLTSTIPNKKHKAAMLVFCALLLVNSPRETASITNSSLDMALGFFLDFLGPHGRIPSLLDAIIDIGN